MCCSRTRKPLPWRRGLDPVTVTQAELDALERKNAALRDASEVAGVRNAYRFGLKGRALFAGATDAEKRAWSAGNERRVTGREVPRR